MKGAHASLPPSNSKAAKEYFANISRSVALALDLQAPDKDTQVYLPRPASLNSFTDAILESLFNAILDNDGDFTGYEHRYGGKLVTFKDQATALRFTKKFPVDIVIGKSSHCFFTAPPLPIWA